MDSDIDRPTYQNALASTRHLLDILPDSNRHPETGIICGSGLSGLANLVHSSPSLQIPYGSIPHFPQSTVEGHAGKLVFGTLGENSHSVVLMVGRLHFYEGHSINDVTFPIRVLKLLGIKRLLVTNAAGGLNPNFKVGDIVVLSDHLNIAGLAGIHPLRGPNVDHFGVRFPPLSEAYDLVLRRLALQVWREGRLDSDTREIHEGVYAFAGGPSYETRAECRMLKLLGADVVGMSTVPEVIVARHSGLDVLAMSLVTNMAVLDPGPAGGDISIKDLSDAELRELAGKGKANHVEVLEAGAEAARVMQLLVASIIQRLSV